MSVSLLTACNASTRSVNPAVKPIIAMPDSSLLKLCSQPVLIPKTAGVQKIVEKLWITDRKALLQCAARQGALADYIRDLITRLQGAS